MSRIGIVGRNSISYVELLINVWNAGDSTVLLDWQMPADVINRLLLELNVTKCFVETNIIEKFDTSSSIDYEAFENNTISQTLLPLHVYRRFIPLYAKREAVILFSSGTTGAAKGVMLSHYAFR